MAATRKALRSRVTTCIVIVCLFMTSGCIRHVSKAREKAVEIPARLDIEVDVENERVIGTRKDIKSGMAYKPATFLFDKSEQKSHKKTGDTKMSGHSTLVAYYQEYEDIPLPLGVTDVQYEARQAQSSKKGRASSSVSLSESSAVNQRGDACNDWCGQGRCTGDSALHYTVEQSIEQLTDFYVCNMERLGWQLVIDFYAHETVLFFDKYDKQCAISLRADMLPNKKFLLTDKKNAARNSTHVTIFVSLRTALL